MPSVINNFKPNPEIAPCKSAYDFALASFYRDNPFLNDKHEKPHQQGFPYQTWYKHDYVQIFKDINAGKLDKCASIAHLIKNDLFFIVYFLARWESEASSGNKPFIVNQCRDIESGPQSDTVDIWSREHGKSTIITIGRTFQRIVNDPECTTAIFSYKAGAAHAFVDAIRKLCELPISILCFPDIFWTNTNESTSWSLQGGIRVKRKNNVRREHTVQGFGLVEGMPTGGHWDNLIFDDVETDDMAGSPDQLLLCFNKMQMAYNLGREGGTSCIIGTFYSHCGVLTRLRDMKDIHGDPLYQVRIFPGTEDGTINGKPVFFSQKYLDSKKTRPGFATQILCNPTPTNEIKLHFDRFKRVPRSSLPESRIKIMIIDPAGDKEVQTGNKNDRWAMLLLSVNPVMDDLGLSDVYLEDGIADQFAADESTDAACSLYLRNGRIAILGVERVGTDSAWLHVKNALKARGRYLDLKKAGNPRGNLMLLAPAGRSKNKKIEDNLTYPLNNGKLHIVDDVPDDIVDGIKMECEKFPFFHVDILDAMAYLYDILADPEFEFLCEGRKKPGKKKDRYVSPGAA